MKKHHSDHVSDIRALTTEIWVYSSPHLYLLKGVLKLWENTGYSNKYI